MLAYYLMKCSSYKRVKYVKEMLTYLAIFFFKCYTCANNNIVFYFALAIKVGVFSVDKHQLAKKASNDYFGDFEMLFRAPHRYEYSTLTLTTLLVLCYSDFLKVKVTKSIFCLCIC
jgi:hypothetical protein